MDTSVSLILIGHKAKRFTPDEKLCAITDPHRISWGIQEALGTFAEFYNARNELIAAYRVDKKGRKPLDLRRYKQRGTPTGYICL